MQNEREEQETDSSSLLAASILCWDHERPLNVRALPFPSTAMQNDGDG